MDSGIFDLKQALAEAMKRKMPIFDYSMPVIGGNEEELEDEETRRRREELEMKGAGDLSKELSENARLREELRRQQEQQQRAREAGTATAAGERATKVTSERGTTKGRAGRSASARRGKRTRGNSRETVVVVSRELDHHCWTRHGVRIFSSVYSFKKQ